MSAFIKLKPCDILATTYKTHPSQTSLDLQTQDGQVWETSYFRIDTDADFSEGIERNLFTGDGEHLSGTFNLSGAIQVITNVALSGSEKRSLNRLRNIYASSAFAKPENFISSSVMSASTPEGQYMTLINIPSILYGEEIKPGSLKIEIKGGANYDLQLTDDGYGGLISSSVLIGSIFYQNGVVLMGHKSQTFAGNWDNSKVHFSGTNTIPMTMYICNAPKGMLNFSNNSSFTIYNTSSNKYEITTSKPQTYITTIGLYDEDYRLLGLAKISKPILNKEETGVQFRLKLNY